MKKDHKVTDYIQYQKGIVDDKLCWRLTNRQFEFKPSGYATHNSGKVVKTDRVLMDDAWIKSNDELYADVKISFEKTIEKYKEEFPLFNVSRLTDFRINRYGVGGFMSNHVDNIHHSHGQQYGFPQATILLFLNDDYEGGEIIIANKQFEPEKGSAIIFPSNFMYPHEVLKVTKGNRWSMVCWLM